MAHWGILTNGRFSIREDHILMLTEVKELYAHLFEEEQTEAFVIVESEVGVDVLVSLTLECSVISGSQ